MTPSPDRTALLRRGRALAFASVAYNVAEGAVALTAGARADSVALTGFGLDSLIEVGSALFVGWGLHVELSVRASTDPAALERVQRRSAVIAGGLLCLLALLLVLDAARRLSGQAVEPAPSTLGLVLTALSILVMPLLARAKLRTAEALGSAALRADAFETIACVGLSVATFAGLALNAWFGWTWADPVAALVLAPLIAREGLEALRGDDCCGHD